MNTTQTPMISKTTICKANYNYSNGRVIVEGDNLYWTSETGGDRIISSEDLTRMIIQDEHYETGLLFSKLSSLWFIFTLIHVSLFEFDQVGKTLALMATALLVVGVYMMTKYAITLEFVHEPRMKISGRKSAISTLKNFLYFKANLKELQSNDPLQYFTEFKSQSESEIIYDTKEQNDRV